MPEGRYIATVFLCLLLATPAWAGFEEGMAALNRSDYVTASREIHQAAEKGDNRAQYQLSLWYETQFLILVSENIEGGKIISPEEASKLPGVPADTPKWDRPKWRGEAVKWLRKAAERGHARGQLSLGHEYSSGIYVPKNLRTAAKWYRKSAEQGDAIGQLWSGHIFLEGKGVSQNVRTAAKWYRKAAEQGQEMAMLRLGHLYEDGLGVLKDYVLAYMWFNIASAEGSKIAFESRERIANKMTPTQLAEAQKLAREWYAAFQKRRAK